MFFITATSFIVFNYFRCLSSTSYDRFWKQNECDIFFENTYHAFEDDDVDALFANWKWSAYDFISMSNDLSLSYFLSIKIRTSIFLITLFCMHFEARRIEMHTTERLRIVNHLMSLFCSTSFNGITGGDVGLFGSVLHF